MLRENEKPAAWKSLVPIQPCGARPPLYCVHAVEGNVNFYYDLARRLGSDQPVYGIQAIGLDGSTPLESVRKMAKHYASEVFSLQQNALCVVAGVCFGTTISIELVEQIELLGGNVGLLIALDTGPIDPRPGVRRDTLPVWKRLLRPVNRILRRLHVLRIMRFGTQRQKCDQRQRGMYRSSQIVYVASHGPNTGPVHQEHGLQRA